MGKSNNLHNELKKNHERENYLHNHLKEHEIKILEDINNCFIKKFIKFFSSFTQNSIKLVFCNTKIGSCNSNKKIIKNLRCLNLVEILPYKYQSFIIFSDEFLSIIIDILFGGGGGFKDKTKRITDITSTETLINKKIIDFITTSFSKIYRQNFLTEINFINKKTFFDFKQSNFNINTVFLINFFNFNINSTEVFFNILIPISIFKHINEKIFLSKNNYHKNICIEKNIENKISLNDIHNVELNITSKIIGISVSYNKLYNLSVGDVLLIEKPDKITGFIEDQAIFWGSYKRFNEQSIVFIEEFINNNLESNQDKEQSHE
ncbi:FliM/FliN family flagellar motor switch protein [Buchnera aphidicola]|uniref:Flagellar motor switch protein FliM n=1 Tax=Buchnera aphidicola (Macrosiphum gaurae) TaxID=2315801 RepID=A0A4D6XY66_9GAMM|nr:FliM/FliN family flagellar motor switch protein [Buchnera aphidicola]QCI22542.1 flagellar motor switch protein FliM [Buchnera aphidicola (Macrosiphum gaurae)]